MKELHHLEEKYIQTISKTRASDSDLFRKGLNRIRKKVKGQFTVNRQNSRRILGCHIWLLKLNGAETMAAIESNRSEPGTCSVEVKHGPDLWGRL